MSDKQTNREDDLGKVIQFGIVDINEVKPDPKQPRKIFNKEELKRLEVSIKNKGLTQPIIVRPVEVNGEIGYYIIIDGERRWRASKALGLKTIPICSRVLNNQESFELSMVSNEFRIDLNPTEEAKAFEKLQTQYGYNQTQIAEVVGKSQGYVSQRLYLLKLLPEIQEMIATGNLPLVYALNLKQYRLTKKTKRLQARVARDLIDGRITVEEAKKILEAQVEKEGLKKTKEREINWSQKKRVIARRIVELAKSLQLISNFNQDQLNLFFEGNGIPKHEILTSFDYLVKQINRIRRGLD